MKIVNFEPLSYSETAIRTFTRAGYSYYESHWEDLDAHPDRFLDVVVLIVRLAKKIDTSILNKLPSLKFIISATTGHDHLDFEAMAIKDIKLFSLRGHTEFLNSIPSTAEHTWALMCALVRHIPAANEHVRQGYWQRDMFRGLQLKNKFLGVVGLGRVGRQVAQYAKAFNMKIGFYDPFVIEPEYTKYNSLEELIAVSDILTIHVHLTDETRNLIGKEKLKMAKPGSLLINTSRGGIWNEEDLAEALRHRKIAGIATDVLAAELTHGHQSPLKNLQASGENIIITPHIGGATYDAMWACEEYIADYFIKSFHKP